MRPHQLRLTAFGPFASTVEVDLDQLAASGLFLLHGPTGAGKTTLLDGLGFALFGRVPGARQGAKRLRSDGAAAALRTEVQLEVTLSGRRLRITRSPQQERAKTRGTGTTTEQAKVLLEEQVGITWTTVSTRVGEADAEIADLVGMSAEQFFQVVLLPQGDFAQFLRANSVDRAAVLQKLFGTERFADVESWLVTRRRTTADELATARAVTSRVVARIAEVAGVDLPALALRGSAVSEEEGGEGGKGGAEPWSTWADGLLSAATSTRTLAQQEVSVATGRRDGCRAAADAAVGLARRQDRLRLTLRRRDELAARRPALLALQAETDAATRAAEVAPVLAAAESRRAIRDGALAAVAVARSGLAGCGLAVDLDAEQLRRTASEATEQSGRLEALRAVDATRRAALGDAARAREDEADALTEAAGFEVALQALPDRRAAQVARLAAARSAADLLPGRRADRVRLAGQRPDLIALAACTEQLEALVREHLSARERALSLAEKAADLRAANVNSMIARLAFALEADTPCPVCGAIEHPDPSALRDEGVSSDDEDRARVAADAAQADAAEVEASIASARATAAALAGRVGDLTLDGVELELAALDLGLAVLVEQAALAAPAESALAALDQQRTDLTAAHVAATSRADAAVRRSREATTRAAEAAAQVAAALAGSAGGSPPPPVHSAVSVTPLEQALASELDRATTATRAADAADALTTAQVELDRALGEVTTACAAAGFAGVEQARAAGRTTDWRATAQADLRAAADASAGVAEALADPDLLAVDLDLPAPVGATAAALLEADGLWEAAVAGLAQATGRLDGLARLLPTLRAELEALVPLEDRAREARALADLCAGTGANGLRMTLTAFVLAARLEQVAAAASTRLLRMTQGRYTLVHTDGAARGGVRSGLGLLARDGWSGLDRDTSTLSGGETFLASLALALGLADVVTAEAGGSRIGALFVDEGFGTLDEETLDEVMDVLDGLREGGRIVGVVSHVAELRQRIPAQVEVAKSRSGSSLVLRGC